MYHALWNIIEAQHNCQELDKPTLENQKDTKLFEINVETILSDEEQIQPCTQLLGTMAEDNMMVGMVAQGNTVDSVAQGNMMVGMVAQGNTVDLVALGNMMVGAIAQCNTVDLVAQGNAVGGL